MNPDEKLQAAGEPDQVLTHPRFTALRHELEMRSRMQTAVAELGQAALTGIDASLLTAQACALVIDTLSVDCARVLEYSAETQSLFTVASVGWSSRISLEAVDSEAVYAFLADEAVVFEDLSSETRFDGQPVLSREGITSGASVRLTGPGAPYGVLGAYTRGRRSFFEYELEFLQSIANVLAAAIASKRTQAELEETRAGMQRRERIAGIASWTWSRGRSEWQWSPELYRMLNLDPRAGRPTYESFLEQVHPADRPSFAALIESAFRVPGEHELTHRMNTAHGETRRVRTIVEGVFGPDETPLRLIGTTHDVTLMARAFEDRVRFGALVELAAQEWRMTCDALDAMVLVVDPQGTIIRLNDRARERCGVQEFEDVVGRPLPREGSEPWPTIHDLSRVVGQTGMAARAEAADERMGRTWEITARSLSSPELGDQRIVVVAIDTTEQVERELVRRRAEMVDSTIDFLRSLLSRVRGPVDRLSHLFGSSSQRELSGEQFTAATLAIRQLDGLFIDLTQYSLPFHLDGAPHRVDQLLRVPVLAAAQIARRRVEVVYEMRSRASVLANPERLRQLIQYLISLAVARVRESVLTIVVSNTEQDAVEIRIESTSRLFTESERKAWTQDELPHLDQQEGLRISVANRIAAEHGGEIQFRERYVALILPRYTQPEPESGD